MNTPYSFEASTERLVYVRKIALEDLPSEVQDQIDGPAQIYSVHAADGQPLALVSDRKMAFELAREHDYRAVAVH